MEVHAMKNKIFMALAALLFVVCMLPLQGCYEENGYGYGPGHYDYGYRYTAYYSEPWYGRRYAYHPWYDHDEWREHHWRWHHDNDEWREHHWGHHWWHHDDDDWARRGRWRHWG
jgi:hypothetical protein